MVRPPPRLVVIKNRFRGAYHKNSLHERSVGLVGLQAAALQRRLLRRVACVQRRLRTRLEDVDYLDAFLLNRLVEQVRVKSTTDLIAASVREKSKFDGLMDIAAKMVSRMYLRPLGLALATSVEIDVINRHPKARRFPNVPKCPVVTIETMSVHFDGVKLTKSEKANISTLDFMQRTDCFCNNRGILLTDIAAGKRGPGNTVSGGAPE